LNAIRSLALVAALLVAAPAGKARAATFEGSVAPIFAKKCAGCHTPANGKPKAGLDLSTAALTIQGGDSGASVLPGDAENSLLVQVVEHRVEPFMPPPAKFPKLSAEEIVAIRAWIDAGAPAEISASAPTPKQATPERQSAEQSARHGAQTGAPAPVTALAFSPQGGLLARGCFQRVELLRLEDAAAPPTTVATLDGHAEQVRALAFSADGTRLAAAGGPTGRAGEVKVWDVAASTAIATITGHSDNILGVALSPDGTRLATCSYDKLIKLWDATTGAEQITLKDHVDAVNAVTFSVDGKMLASAGSDRTVKLWDAATGERLFTLSDATDAVLCVAFSPDGRYVAAGAADKRIRVWDVLESGKNFMQSGLTRGVMTHATFAHEGAVLQLLYSPDGQTLYSAAEDKRVKAWEAASMKETRLFPPQSDWVLALALSPDGKYLAAGRYDATDAIYDAETTAEAFVVAEQAVLADATSTRKKVTSGDVDLVLINATIPPSLQSFNPTRQPRGTEFEASVRGMNLEGATAFFDDAAIQVEILSNTAGAATEPKRDPNSLGAQIFDTAVPHELKLKVTVPEGVGPGQKFLFCRTPLGLAEGASFFVLPNGDVGEVEPNNASEEAQLVAWPTVLIGSMNTEGDIDRFKLEVEAGKELVCMLTDLAPGFVLRLLDSAGNELSNSGKFGAHTDARLGFHFDTAGAYFIEVSHRDFLKDHGYRLHIGEFPWAYAVSPLGVQAGVPTSVHVKGYNLGGSSEMQISPPKDARPWTTIALPLPDYANNPVPSVRLAVAKYPVLSESEPNNATEQVGAISAMQTVDGVLMEDGDVDLYRFSAQAGQSILFDVFAARLGSELDSVIDILDAQGKLLPRAKVRCVGQTFITLGDRDSMASGIRIDDWSDMAVNDYVMSGNEIMQVFRLPGYADEDITLRTHGGRRMAFFGTTPEYHAVNAPVYKVEIHDLDEEFAPNGMPIIPIYWTNDDAVYDEGRAGDSQLEFTAPAASDYFVRVRSANGAGGPTHGYRLMLREREPDFDFFAGPYRVNVPEGGSVPVDVRVRRRDGFDLPVHVAFHGLPEGLSVPEVVIPAGMESMQLPLRAAPGAGSTEPYAHFKIIATAKRDGQDLTRESGIGAITVVKRQPDLEVSTDIGQLALKPGETGVIQVKLDRHNGFDSRVPLDVLNLPFGVRVLDTGLNGILVREGEYERQVRIYAEPWVQPFTQPIFVQARIESRAPGRMLFLGPQITLQVAEDAAPVIVSQN